MSSQENIGIALVSYGSLNSHARKTYEKIRSDYVEAFPGADVRLAFTSDIIKRALLEQGIFIPDTRSVLAELRNQGCRNVVVQSLHVVAGSEFRQIARLVHERKNVREKSWFGNLETGMPLLSSQEDCKKVSEALQPEFQSIKNEGQNHGSESSADSEDVAIVLMGHGASHPADMVYSLMARTLENDYKNVFLGTLDGFPGIDEVLSKAKKSMVNKVVLMPFLLVAGGHALEDLAGDSASSWRSIFEREGFRTQVVLKGLGENDSIIDIFVEHTRKADLMFRDG